MVFSGHATNQDIVSDTRWLISGSPTGATDYGINDLTRNINRWYDRIVSLILKSDGRWEWDDDNYDTLPVSTSPLLSGQVDYNVASSDFLNLIRVEIKDSSGNWVYLNPISYEDKKGVAMTEWAETPGTPEVYDKVGNSIFLYPTPNYASAAGLKVYFQRIPSYFSFDDTTKEPGFSPIFHRLLSLGAAYDYCLLNGLNNKLTILSGEIGREPGENDPGSGMLRELVNYYSKRSKDEQPRISLHKENFSGEDYIGRENSVS